MRVPKQTMERVMYRKEAGIVAVAVALGVTLSIATGSIGGGIGAPVGVIAVLAANRNARKKRSAE